MVSNNNGKSEYIEKKGYKGEYIEKPEAKEEVKETSENKTHRFIEQTFCSDCGKRYYKPTSKYCCYCGRERQ